MEDQALNIKTLLEKTEQYMQTNVELYKLKAIDKSADLISILTANLTVILFITLFFLVLNIGIALWLGELLGAAYYGFFIVAGLYAVIGGVVYVFRNGWIKRPLRRFIINKTLK